MGYRTIEEIKAANIAARFHFFAPGLMRLRDTRVYPEVYLGRYFITSERNAMLAQSPRGFSIREVLPDSSIKLVGRFQQFQTLQEAKNSILRIVGADSAGFKGDHRTTKPRSTGRSSTAGARRPPVEDTRFETLDALAIERLRELKRNRTMLLASRNSDSAPGSGQIAEPASQNTASRMPADKWQVSLDRQLGESGDPNPEGPIRNAVARAAPPVEKHLPENPTSQITRARGTRGSVLPWRWGTARRGKPDVSRGAHELESQNLEVRQAKQPSRLSS